VIMNQMSRDPRDLSTNDLSSLDKEGNASPAKPSSPTWKFSAVAAGLTTVGLLPVFIMGGDMPHTFVFLSHAFLKIFLVFMVVERVAGLMGRKASDTDQIREAVKFMIYGCGSCALPALFLQWAFKYAS
ncbi:hypothetical protein TeGR_g3834, partial [Tetraparma gracilis]